MNVQDLLKAVEDHVKAAGDDVVKPILLPVHVWHAAKGAYMRAYGEGTMFVHPQHPHSFMVSGVPIVADVEPAEGNADSLLPVAAVDKTGAADRILHQDGTSAMIEEASTQAATFDPTKVGTNTSATAVQIGEPRPELEQQEEPAIEVGEDGLLKHVKADEPAGDAPEPQPIETAGVVEEAPKPLEPTYLGGHTQGGQEQLDGVRAATAPVPEDVERDHVLDAHEEHEPATGFAAMSQKADEEKA